MPRGKGSAMTDSRPPSSVLSNLTEGYHRFRDKYWHPQRERWMRLSEGQSPKVMIIACSDSRVDPAQIFDVDPGQIFVVRNVAAMVPPFETTPGHHGVSAALEFAVQVLEVEEIVVMGHGMCGGCKAALTQQMHGAEPGKGGFIADWIDLLDEARQEVVGRYGAEGQEAERAMEHAGVRVSIANLRSFPCIKQREGKGRIRLRGAFFAISDGILYWMDEETGAFEPAA
jgi:carbonic anhydrase